MLGSRPNAGQGVYRGGGSDGTIMWIERGIQRRTGIERVDIVITGPTMGSKTHQTGWLDHAIEVYRGGMWARGLLWHSIAYTMGAEGWDGNGGYWGHGDPIGGMWEGDGTGRSFTALPTNPLYFW